MGVADSPSAGLLGVLSRRRDGAQFGRTILRTILHNRTHTLGASSPARIARSSIHVGGAGAWVLLGVRSVGAQGVGAARPHQAGQSNGAFVAAVVGEPFITG